MIKFITNNKIMLWVALALTVGATYFALRNDSFLYQKPIAQVVSVKQTSQNESTDSFDNKVENKNQVARVKFLNDGQAGRIVTVKNDYDTSRAMTQELKTGMQIFLVHQGDDSWGFANLKRDSTWVPFLVALIGTLLILMGQAGRLTALSLGINTALFTLTVWLDLALGTGWIVKLFFGFSIITSVTTLGLVMGFRNRQTWVVFATVMTATLSAMGIAALVFATTNGAGIHFELLEFITQLPKPMFFAITLVGVLGAVMDESTDMIATLFSLKKENPDVSTRELITAGRHVGQEIFGALSNVLFLIFIAAQVPMALLYLRNGNNLGYTYDMNMALGMAQTMISAIGIVLTVPAGIMWVLISQFFEHRKLRNKS
ncbi:MAG: YibE/F family protein [Lactobacillaceae bacterium]|jgi:uncharacterized membrane protein|nr:YibE/F family protein [Lactobacillaceae bacterium]